MDRSPELCGGLAARVCTRIGMSVAFAFAAAAVLSAASPIANEGVLCHGKCLNPNYEKTGECPSSFCGAGRCCQLGSSQAALCNGLSMGCDGFKCCACGSRLTLEGPPAWCSCKLSSSADDAAIAPLSECAIARVTYEIGRMRHDAAGDKVFEVLVKVEPKLWRSHCRTWHSSITRPMSTGVANAPSRLTMCEAGTSLRTSATCSTPAVRLRRGRLCCNSATAPTPPRAVPLRRRRHRRHGARDGSRSFTTPQLGKRHLCDTICNRASYFGTPRRHRTST